MEEKYIGVGGIRTRYLEAGSGEPFVLVHGGEYGRIANANAWDLVIDGLAARGFHVFALDKIGNGFSDHPGPDEDLLIGRTVDHLRGFIDALGLKSTHIAGHSRGGYTVTRLALENPGQIKTLVVVSSGTVMARINPIYDRWNEEAAKINDPRERLRYQIASNSFSTDHISEEYLKIHLRIVARPETQETRQRMVTGGRKRFIADVKERQKDILDRIIQGGLTMPTLITWGLNDPSATFDPVGIEALKLFLPNASKAEGHIFSRSGHYVFREQANSFIDVVAGYIARTR